MKPYRYIRRDVGNDVAMVSLGDGASARTRMTPALLDELADCLGDVESTGAARVIVVTGGPRVFALGADLEAMAPMSTAQLDGYLRQGQEVMAAFGRSRLLTIAAINGLALGGGFELALACDMRWAHPRAVFEFPEYKLGLTPAWGGALFLRGVVSPSLAIELLCGRRIGAQVAHQVGLVSRILPGASFLQEVRRSAESLARTRRETLCALKDLSRGAPTREAHLEMERQLFLAQFPTHGRGQSPVALQVQAEQEP